MEEMKAKRKNYFIRKDFQIKFISLFLCLIIGSSLFLGWIIYRMSNQELAKTFYESHLQVKSTWEIISPSVVIATLLAIFVTGIATIVITLLASHRIAGPLYRFEKTLEELANGNLTTMTNLRANDELSVMAERFNTANKELNYRLRNIKEGIEKLSKSFKELNQILDGKISNEAVSKNKEIQDGLAQVTKIISQFKLRGRGVSTTHPEEWNDEGSQNE